MIESKPIYLDYAATTPVDPRVVAKMTDCLLSPEAFGNAASKHAYGQAAHAQIEVARSQIANLIGAVPRDLIFTAGATEANNLAIRGIADYYRDRGNHLITCQTEHKAVLDVYRALEKEGFEVTYLAVLSNGLIDLEMLKNAIRKETILVSIMQVNNETGVIQDIGAIGKITRAKGIFLHVDAAQSLGKMKINLQDLRVDLMSFSAHKIYGPKGIGALYVGSHPAVRLVPQIVGGGQERKLRAGTLATHQIVGFGEACRLLSEALPDNLENIKALSDRLWLGIKDLPGVFLNTDRKCALPHFLNVRFVGWAKKGLDVSFPNLAVSAASACNTINLEPSHVLKAMGYNEDEARQSIRFSLGQFTRDVEINKAIDLIRAACLDRGMI